MVVASICNVLLPAFVKTMEASFQDGTWPRDQYPSCQRPSVDFVQVLMGVSAQAVESMIRPFTPTPMKRPRSYCTIAFRPAGKLETELVHDKPSADDCARPPGLSAPTATTAVPQVARPFTSKELKGTETHEMPSPEVRREEESPPAIKSRPVKMTERRRCSVPEF